MLSLTRCPFSLLDLPMRFKNQAGSKVKCQQRHVMGEATSEEKNGEHVGVGDDVGAENTLLQN